MLECMEKPFREPTFTWPFRVALFVSVVPFVVALLLLAAVAVFGMSPSLAAWGLPILLIACGSTAATQIFSGLTGVVTLASSRHMRTALNIIAIAVAIFSLVFLSMIGWAWRIGTLTGWGDR